MVPTATIGQDLIGNCLAIVPILAAGSRVEFPEINGQNVHGNLLSVGAGEVTNYAAV